MHEEFRKALAGLQAQNTKLIHHNRRLESAQPRLEAANGSDADGSPSPERRASRVRVNGGGRRGSTRVGRKKRDSILSANEVDHSTPDGAPAAQAGATPTAAGSAPNGIADSLASGQDPLLEA
jgi:hypothetical protein